MQYFSIAYLLNLPFNPRWFYRFVFSNQNLQDAAEDLQRGVGNVLAASKRLIGRLEPLAVNIIQSETRLLSHDDLLLSRAMSGEKKSLQVRKLVYR